tara:strand:- start:176 stop:379 length:204 start_codon:yes stop_codon:yes gene_type:complete
MAKWWEHLKKELLRPIDLKGRDRVPAIMSFIILAYVFRNGLVWWGWFPIIGFLILHRLIDSLFGVKP